MRNAVVVVVLAVAVSMLVPRVNAQDAETTVTQETFRTLTDLVPVDVSVLDRDRRPVRGLTPADFRLVVDGKPRPIAAFSEVEIATPGTVTSPWPQGETSDDVVTNEVPGEGRLLVILLDGSIPNGAPMVSARSIAHAAIDQLGPGDLAAVVRSSVFSGNGRSQGFTNDRRRLSAAIDSPFMGTTEAPGMVSNGLASPSPVPGSLFQTQLQCEVILHVSQAMAHASRRRKVLLFIGSRLALGGETTIGGERRFCRDEMMRELIGSNVTVHVVDPVGILTSAVAADYLGPVSATSVQEWAVRNQQRLDVLRALPELTGGRAVVHTNGPERFVAGMLEESGTYYLLGFDPEPLGGGKSPHKIRVEVARRNVRVRSRASYTRAEATISETQPPKVSAPTGGLPPEIAAALTGPLASDALPLSVTVAPFAIPDLQLTAAVAVVVEARLTLAAGAQPLMMTVAAFDDRGRGIAVRSQAVEVSGNQRSLTDSLITRLDLPPGSYDLRVAVRDGGGRVGSVFTFVDVPDFWHGSMSASGLVLYRSHAVRIVGSPLKDILPGAPTAQRSFSASEEVNGFVRFYRTSQESPLSVSCRIVGAAGEERLEPVEVATMPTERTSTLRCSLPLASLEPGRYRLTMAAKDDRSQVERDVRFEVVRP